MWVFVSIIFVSTLQSFFCSFISIVISHNRVIYLVYSREVTGYQRLPSFCLHLRLDQKVQLYGKLGREVFFFFFFSFRFSIWPQVTQIRSENAALAVASCSPDTLYKPSLMGWAERSPSKQSTEVEKGFRQEEMTGRGEMRELRTGESMKKKNLRTAVYTSNPLYFLTAGSLTVL